MSVNRLYRWPVIVFLTVPALIYLLIAGFENENPMETWELVHRQTGYIALALTILVFILNPLLASFPKFPLAANINLYRRNIGVAAFCYGCIHFLAVVKFKTYEHGSFPWIALLIHPVLLPAAIALIIFLLLSITSNNYSVRKLGGKRWKKLHHSGYIAEWGIFFHLLLQFGNVAVIGILSFIPLFILQWMRRKKRLQRIKPNE